MKMTIVAALLLASTLSQARPLAIVDMSSWKNLKDMCENYKEFGAQLPPEDIQVKCVVTKRFTGITGSKDISFPSSTALVMSISSTKAKVAPNTSAVTASPVIVQCPIVAQFKQVSSGTFPSTCSELTGYKGTFSEFCLEKLATGNYEGEAEQIQGTERSLCAPEKTCQEEALN